MKENNPMLHKTLIAFSGFLFACSALFLFWQNERELDPDRNKSWWTLSFAAPQTSTDLSFTIMNHSDQTEFRYEVTASKEVLATETFSVDRGAELTITPALTAEPDKRTTVTVSTEKGKKEIYR